MQNRAPLEKLWLPPGALAGVAASQSWFPSKNLVFPSRSVAFMHIRASLWLFPGALAGVAAGQPWFPRVTATLALSSFCLTLDSGHSGYMHFCLAKCNTLCDTLVALSFWLTISQPQLSQVCQLEDCNQAAVLSC